MGGLKVKASSLIELLIATVIICISMIAISVVFLHYYKSAESSDYKKIRTQILRLEKEILKDSHFPASIHKYQDSSISVTYYRLIYSDSILVVHLNYKTKFGDRESGKNFIYAKD